MRITIAAMLAAAALIMPGCSQEPQRPVSVSDKILGGLDRGRGAQKQKEPDAVNQALLPPLRMDLPQSQGRPIDARFDLNVNNAPAREVFMSIVSGTRYSMLVHPDVSGTISVNLKDVSIAEALDGIREIYGYEYKFDGSRIYIQPAGLQTRVFQVNYLTGARQGRSDMRVSAGSATGQQVAAGAATTTNQAAAQVAPIVAPPVAAGAAAGGVAGPPSLTPGLTGAITGVGSTQGEASRVATTTLTDLWQEIAFSLRAIVGITGNNPGDGRSVIISPQSGVVVVRALPQELRNVDNYLKAMRVSVERQVMIEAKIIDVTLSENYQSGINWAAFPTSGISAGFTNSNLSTSGVLSGSNFITDSGSRALGAAGAGLATAGTAGGAFGLAVQTQNFAALLQFLESQGTVQVLSSPRIAAINNQKAVLKVGSDERFVTDIAQGTATQQSGNFLTTVSTAVPVLGTLFSGISLDITPQIDDSGMITLHIHPLVSKVAQKNLVVDFGTGARTFPVASAEINESDTIVRAQDGNIVVLGGLMKVELADTRGGVPGLSDAPGIGALFRNTGKGTVKKELIILIKATVIHGDKNWEQEIQDSRERLQRMGDDRQMAPSNQRQ